MENVPFVREQLGKVLLSKIPVWDEVGPGISVKKENM